MPRLPKRRLALLIALVAVLAGGTAVALGATTSSSPAPVRIHHAGRRRRAGMLSAAASYLGISRAQLRSDLASGKTLAQIAAATPGRSEAGLVAALEAADRSRLQSASSTVPSRVQKLVHATIRGEKAGAGRHIRLRQVVLAYLGLEPKALAAQLRGGRSLAQIAEATPGKSANGLREALVAAFEQRLQSRLASGAITKAAEQSRLTRAEQRIATVLTRTRTGHHTR